jgi:hypothetical protein
MRHAAILAAFILSLAGAARAETAAIDPTIGKVEITLELPKDKPYVGEMIMLRMRSFIRAFIVLDEIQQPPLTNFDWQQLGRDKPIQAMVDGFSVAGVERDIAIFPQQSGRLVIEPFVRRVTIVTDDNRRVPLEFASKTLFVDIQNHAGVGAPDAWWLPAKSLTLTDTWSVAPDEIKPGELARRTVTVEAVGLTADRLPPAPTLLAPGTIAFKGPAQRETTITENGPVARATYQWDIRPVSTSPAQLPAIHIPWFDTTERRLRDAAIPNLWVAYIGTLVHTSHETVKTWAQTYLARGPIVVGAAGFAWTTAFAVVLLASRRRRPKRPLRRRALRGLQRSARFNDEPGVRAALAELARHDPALWSHLSRASDIRDRLAAFDRARFARDGGHAPALRTLAAGIVRRAKVFDDANSTPSDAIPPLDGPLLPGPEASWRARLKRL